MSKWTRLVLLACVVLAAGCSWLPHIPDIPDLPDLPDITNQPPVDPPQPDVLKPIKIAHGSKVGAKGDEGRDGSTTIDGVKFRIFEIDSDRHFCEQARKAKALQARDGKMVAHDFLNNAGQVMVWQYWTLGTSSINGKSTDNPVATVKQDTRVWYRTYASLTQPPTPDPIDPVDPPSGNVPPFYKPSDVPSFDGMDKPENLGTASPGQYHGSFQCANQDEATATRYHLMGWMWHVAGVQTGYPTDTNPKRGCVDVRFRSDIPASQPRLIEWSVNP